MSKGVIQCARAIILTLVFACIVCFVYMLMASNEGFSSPNESANGQGGRSIFDFAFSDILSSKQHKNNDKDSNKDSSSIEHGNTSFLPSSVMVKTSYGQYRGFTQDVFGKQVHTFLGIPYANAPIGSLRFRKPTPLVPQPKHVFPADKFKSKCVQIKKKVPVFTDVSAGVSEDCLFLNIWTTRVNKTADASLLPVMIWVYGGGFFMGTSAFDETDGRVLASYADVVVVTFDYRLGGLGFLDLGTEKEAGNQGLYDQVAAMKWVKDNIKHFGGDPASITLFGESSGAIAIGLHMLSSESEGVFKRAILQSGSPFMTNSFFQRSEKSIPDFVKTLGCSSDDGYDVECMRRKSVSEIIDATQTMHEKYFFAFPPSAEEEFLPMIPTEFVRLGRGEKEEIVNNVQEIMIGNNANAFSYMLWLANKKIFTKDRVTKSFTSIDQVKEIMQKDLAHLLQMPKFQVNFITQRLFKHLVNQTEPESWLNRLIEILGDVSFVCPSNILIDEMSSLGKTVYVYEFDHRRKSSPWGQWFGSSLHDEIPFVFGHPLRFPDRYEGRDIDLSKRMMQTWATFAKSGHPDPQLGTDWLPTTSDDRSYMQLNPDAAVVRHNQSQQSCETFRLGFELLNK